ncbi:MAG: hypothetical protein FWC27_12445 [Firmicutes bacterium]|nr:hypothetical protein [Bacillota bacterium]
MSWAEFWSGIVTSWDMLWTGAKPFLPGLFEIWWSITVGMVQVGLEVLFALF